MSLPTASQSWRMPDEPWEKVKPFLPPRKPHPLGCHRSRVDDLVNDLPSEQVLPSNVSTCPQS
jgi:hypothetical protein